MVYCHHSESNIITCQRRISCPRPEGGRFESYPRCNEGDEWVTQYREAIGAYYWVKENIKYCWAPWRGPEYTVAIRKGHCGAKSELLVSMLRKRGIPARYVEGREISGARHLIPGLTTLIPALNIHFWLEANIDGEWLTLDAAHDSGIAHFLGDTEPGVHLGQCARELRWEELPIIYKRLYNNPFFAPVRLIINTGLAYHRRRR